MYHGVDIRSEIKEIERGASFISAADRFKLLRDNMDIDVEYYCDGYGKSPITVEHIDFWIDQYYNDEFERRDQNINLLSERMKVANELWKQINVK